MDIYIVRIGDVEKNILELIRKGIEEAFPDFICKVREDFLQLPKEAYNPLRKQYRSELLLKEVFKHASKIEYESGRPCILLGVTDVDIYVPKMNFIFGEAQCPGKAAIISLYRLRPEFYGDKPDRNLFIERSIKEAVHEIGHACGLTHCSNPLCVMHFSLHIGMTDTKQPRFCRKCLAFLEARFRNKR